MAPRRQAGFLSAIRRQRSGIGRREGVGCLVEVEEKDTYLHNPKIRQMGISGDGVEARSGRRETIDSVLWLR